MGLFNVVGRATMAAGQPEDVTQILANFDAIAAVLNGGIDNSNVNAAAALLLSKLAGYPADGTKFASGDGTWKVPPGASLLAKSRRTTVVSTTATSFATGADVLASAFSFTADGVSDYTVTLSCDYIFGSVANLEGAIALNLDGSNFGAMGIIDIYAGGKGCGVTWTYTLVAPAAGVHTVNGRLYITFGGPGTLSMDAGTGAIGGGSAILMKVEKLP